LQASPLTTCEGVAIKFCESIAMVIIASHRMNKFVASLIWNHLF
jgi:hypothetical protein